MPPAVRSRFRRRAVGLFLILLTTAILLELILQIAAVTIWLKNRPAASPAGGIATILCVGDSFTWGVGASDREHAYPPRLEHRLRESTGRDWRVVSAGWPGRDSREALSRLPAQIREHHPRCVCLLI